MRFGLMIFRGAGIIALAFPLLEWVGIYWVWQFWGFWTLAALALGGLVGVALLADLQAGWAYELMSAVSERRSPAFVLKGLGLRIAAALLFIFPGFLSDLMAVFLLFWPVRNTVSEPVDDGVIEGQWRREGETSTPAAQLEVDDRRHQG